MFFAHLDLPKYYGDDYLTTLSLENFKRHKQKYYVEILLLF